MENRHQKRPLRKAALEQAVVEAFRRGGWHVVSQPHLVGGRPDLVLRRGNRQYVVELKSSAEARRDRLLPLLAQGILQAKAYASNAHLSPRAEPLAVIGAANLPEPLIDDLRSFAAEVAPDVAIGIIDLEGSRIFIGKELEGLSQLSKRPKRAHPFPHLGPQLHLFSDLNQWMLKVLLASRIPEGLLHAPRQKIDSVSDLARAANVSLMSALRCVNLLRAEGFLEESDGLQLANIEMLLGRWRAASHKPAREVPMRWLIPGDPHRQLSDAVRAHLDGLESALRASRSSRAQQAVPHPRVCLGLFAAADALGYKFVRGVASHLYLERLDPFVLESLGLASARPGQSADVFVRVPSFRESVFRAAVKPHGIPVCDILQVWLDVADHPARGASQAQQIWRNILAPLWKGTSS
jgi:hypothetical protein